PVAAVSVGAPVLASRALPARDRIKSRGCSSGGV
ncbi:MAG: hypothetical protein QOD76_1505, partial [Solirubrobacteraceae bacterium]|nr:hypothetical protein [Solirubrobacteraceae bacterium]